MISTPWPGTCWTGWPPAAEKGRVQLRLDGEKAVVTGVRHVVDEMVFNLADNAVKYNRPGGSVTITTGMEKGKPWFSVADTGIGIPADSRGAGVRAVLPGG